MVDKSRVVFPIIVIALVLALSGCTTQKAVSELSPPEVVTQFWTDIGDGNYDHAYDLAYHGNQNLTRQMWVDEHKSKWGENGSYITVYSFNVTGIENMSAEQFEGNFSEVKIVNTNATIGYLGQNETGELRMIVVNTTAGWKVFGNY
jgi:hypothetical protein